MKKKGVILINLGTPDDPDPRSVKRYLSEFLNDPRVIDLPQLTRYILTKSIIIPFRHRKTAKAYQKIWGSLGSPLKVHSQQLQTALSERLGNDYQIEIAMRYGSPPITSVLKKMQDVDQLMVIPLYPQYSSAATGSALEIVLQEISKQWNIPDLFIKKDFYDESGYINACAEIIRDNRQTHKIDHVIFSYHGLPVRHIKKSACKAICDGKSACPAISQDNVYCYRAQCYATTALLVEKLGLTQAEYSVGFQSRLGRTPWIKPYTDKLLPELLARGIKSIAIVCPSFVADCLETLEEINIRAREAWMKLGGEQFHYIPCINHHPLWVKGLSDMVQQHLGNG